MKTLVPKVLEKAASEGGEVWLKRCLAELEAEPAQVGDVGVNPSAPEVVVDSVLPQPILAQRS